MSGEVVLVSTDKSEYLSDMILEELQDLEVNIHKIGVHRQNFPNGEKYYRLELPMRFSLINKTALYIASILNDDDLMDMYRVGSALVQAGIQRRIFVIPFLAYGSMDRATMSGEVVTAKCNSTMLGMVGSTSEGNVFVFLDLHYACLLHYFEGPSLRIELQAKSALLRDIAGMHFDMSKVVVGSTNLRRAAWVNEYAMALQVPVSFIREKIKGDDEIAFRSDADLLVGEVSGKHVLIYDDLIRTGRTIIGAAKKYLEAGAVRVDAVTSHLACFDDAQIQALIDSPLQTIIATNSHPVTKNPLIKNSKKFHIIDVSDTFTQCLYEILPSPEHMHRSSL